LAGTGPKKALISGLKKKYRISPFIAIIARLTRPGNDKSPKMIHRIEKTIVRIRAHLFPRSRPQARKNVIAAMMMKTMPITPPNAIIISKNGMSANPGIRSGP